MTFGRERGYRITGFAFLAWIAMIGMLAVMAAVKSESPGFRDSDVSSPLEGALMFAIVMALPFAIVAGGVLAPSAFIADRIIRGRLTRGANIAVGSSFAIPAFIGFLGIGWLVLGSERSFADWFAALRRGPDLMIGLLIVFAVGGVVISLGMRHRNPA